MATNDFETTSLAWQIQQLEQQVGEWFEYYSASFFKNVNVSGIEIAPSLKDFLIWVAWIIFTITLCWLGLLLFRLLRPYFLIYSRQIMGLGNIAAKPEIEPVYSVDGWLKMARKFQLEGNYPEACRALYMGMLQSLSDRSLVPQQFSRTDGEYRNLVLDLPQSQSYQVLLNTHEQLCFSDRPISSELFHTCQAAYTEINQQPSGQNS